MNRLILAAAILSLLAAPAFAAGTLSDTDIDNRASVVYELSGVPQTAIESSPTGNSTPGADQGADTTFKVDNKIDLTVEEADANYTITGAGAAEQVTTFIVTNDGNTVQDYSLSVADQGNGADPFGGNDNFDTTAFGIFVDTDGDDLYDPAIDTDTYIDELGPDLDVRVFVVRNIPAGRADGDIAAVILTAQTAVGGTADTQGADILTDDEGDVDDPTLVQTVFADGAGDTDAANDGAHSDTDAYRVGTAQITVQKSSAVISDPINGVSADAKAIPGAIIEYTITVSNGAGASSAATGITVTDSLATEITAGTVAFVVDSYGAPASELGIEVTAPNINGGAAQALTNSGGDDEGSFAANTVTVDGIELDAGESATVKFRVEIQ